MAPGRAARAAVVALAALGLAGPAVADPRRTVLLVFDEDPGLPGLTVINRSLRETFREALGGDVEFWSEALNLSQFEDPGYHDLVRDHFARKYARRSPDLIVAVMQPSLDFLLGDGRALFPGVPVVFCGIDRSYLDGQALPPNVTGVVIRRDYSPTVEIALRLQPATRSLYVVGGTAEFDRQLQAIARRDLAPFADRLRITYLTDLPMPELLAAVAALPERSAILYLTLFTDGAGRSYVPHDALARIAAVANAPVYVAVDQYLDLGVVGGRVYGVGTHGRQAAEIGLRILRGETTGIPVVEEAAQTSAFDWRQVRRWGIDESLLPPGSEVRHRAPSAWDQYRGYVLGGVAVAALQSALIVGLLVSRAERRRADAATRQAEALRRRAEEEARRQRDELAHALRLTTLGELAASFAHEIGQPLAAILANAQALQQLAAADRMRPGELEDALGDIERDVARAAETLQRLRRLVRRQDSERGRVDLNAIVDDVVRLLRGDLAGKEIRVEFRRGEGLPEVAGDAVQLRQVVLNLLVNAEEAIAGAPSGAREVRIETRPAPGGAVALDVRDTGCGATEAEIERMFDRFVSSKPNGLGLGLAISRSIVTAHRGRIWATRNADRGLSLHVELPAADVAEPPPEA